jgi:ABC-type lipopolysaccharide export system ATPase subunit
MELADDKSIIKIDNLNIPDPTKVGVVFLEKLSSAIGALHKPSQIKNIAKAEAEATITKAEAEAKADLTRAETKFKINELQNRALARFVAEEAKKQENIEQIAQKVSFLRLIDHPFSS